MPYTLRNTGTTHVAKTIMACFNDCVTLVRYSSSDRNYLEILFLKTCVFCRLETKLLFPCAQRYDYHKAVQRRTLGTYGFTF